MQQIFESKKLNIMNGLHKKWKVFHKYCLVTQFEMSRIPIRQALTRLVREGYVNFYDNLGVFVLCNGLIFSNMRKEKEWI
ncbi:GntR family transcriptional regulator [Bacillus cereus]|uniref:GntR family transcriptional regulator n=1 Tax=Bacillus cereus TaxID=1396 RepID=UPI000952B514|nr:GntR family transcriptional regulator [Bacillus cereus]OLR24673.1 hypothetical protein BLD50_16285 [Bacillus cereus]